MNTARPQDAQLYFVSFKENALVNIEPADTHASALSASLSHTTQTDAETEGRPLCLNPGARRDPEDFWREILARIDEERKSHVLEGKGGQQSKIAAQTLAGMSSLCVCVCVFPVMFLAFACFGLFFCCCLDVCVSSASGFSLLLIAVIARTPGAHACVHFFSLFVISLPPSAIFAHLLSVLCGCLLS